VLRQNTDADVQRYSGYGKEQDVKRTTSN